MWVSDYWVFDKFQYWNIYIRIKTDLPISLYGDQNLENYPNPYVSLNFTHYPTRLYRLIILWVYIHQRRSQKLSFGKSLKSLDMLIVLSHLFAWNMIDTLWWYIESLLMHVMILRNKCTSIFRQMYISMRSDHLFMLYFFLLAHRHLFAKKIQ